MGIIRVERMSDSIPVSVMPLNKNFTSVDSRKVTFDSYKGNIINASILADYGFLYHNGMLICYNCGQINLISMDKINLSVYEGKIFHSSLCPLLQDDHMEVEILLKDNSESVEGASGDLCSDVKQLKHKFEEGCFVSRKDIQKEETDVETNMKCEDNDIEALDKGTVHQTDFENCDKIVLDSIQLQEITDFFKNREQQLKDDNEKEGFDDKERPTGGSECVDEESEEDDKWGQCHLCKKVESIRAVNMPCSHQCYCIYCAASNLNLDTCPCGKKIICFHPCFF